VKIAIALVAGILVGVLAMRFAVDPRDKFIRDAIDGAEKQGQPGIYILFLKDKYISIPGLPDIRSGDLWESIIPRKGDESGEKYQVYVGDVIDWGMGRSQVTYKDRKIEMSSNYFPVSTKEEFLMNFPVLVKRELQYKPNKCRGEFIEGEKIIQRNR
jgi:hypothetical protein